MVKSSGQVVLDMDLIFFNQQLVFKSIKVENFTYFYRQYKSGVKSWEKDLFLSCIQNFLVNCKTCFHLKI